MRSAIRSRRPPSASSRSSSGRTKQTQRSSSLPCASTHQHSRPSASAGSRSCAPASSAAATAPSRAPSAAARRIALTPLRISMHRPRSPRCARRAGGLRALGRHLGRPWDAVRAAEGYRRRHRRPASVAPLRRLRRTAYPDAASLRAPSHRVARRRGACALNPEPEADMRARNCTMGRIRSSLAAGGFALLAGCTDLVEPAGGSGRGAGHDRALRRRL